MERRLAEIPTEEWNDVRVDITPREYVLDYLAHSFPVQLYEPFTDSEGNLSSRPVYRDGQPVECREAVARRDELIEKLASCRPCRARSTRSSSASAPTWWPRSRAARAGSCARARAGGAPRRREPRRLGQPRRDRRPSWMTRSASSSSRMPAARGAAITPTLGAEPAAAGPLSAGTGLEGRRRHPGPRAAPTAPIRRSRRCSGRSPPM
jgi:hypothetical protein